MNLIKIIYFEGYSGLRCETKINECSYNPCKHGGRCQTLITGGFKCDCKAGFTGGQHKVTLNNDTNDGVNNICLTIQK